MGGWGVELGKGRKGRRGYKGRKDELFERLREVFLG